MNNIELCLGINDLPIEILLEVEEIGGSGDYPVYDGKYEVTPRKSEQELLTKNRLMLNDIKVLEIPYAEVSNLSGGKTVTIGMD